MLNDDVLAREVASGFLIARVGWRFKNDANSLVQLKVFQSTK
jgi:hypothetical protein